jgi:hypothetical protein
VRFPDGTIRYGMYCGTTDVLWPRLFDTQDEAWSTYAQTEWSSNAWREAFYPAPEGKAEDVEVSVDYGAGFHWPAKAARNAMVAPLRWDDFKAVLVDGIPDWAEECDEWLDVDPDDGTTKIIRFGPPAKAEVGPRG